MRPYIIYITKIAACIGLLVSGAGCTANYEKINRNNNEVTAEEKKRDDYAVTGALVGLQNAVVSTKINQCQFIDCLLGGPWGGYFADSNSEWNSNKMSTYNAANNWMSPMFKDVIPDYYTNFLELQNSTFEPVPLAVGLILKVAIMHRVTDTFGPIPYSEIGKDGQVQVKYDTQQDIYNMFFEELDQAIDVLTDNLNLRLSKAADLSFGGDLEKWVRFANSLKLRLAMRIVYADETLAKQMAEQAVNHPVGVMRDNDDNASLKSFGSDGNPIYASASYNSAGSSTGGDHHASADITSYMNGYNDPRRAAYFLNSTFSGYEYVGLRSGITIPSTAVVFQYAGIKLNFSSYLQWMNAAEVMFLKAEGALRNWNMGGGTAKDFYEQGVQLSFDQWGASGAAAYLAGTSPREPYTDPEGQYTYLTQTSTRDVAWQDGDFDKSLERIIVQKWIANWTLGIEAWAERRRTGYPVFMPVVYNGSGGVLADGDIPRRLPYPLEEYQGNNENVVYAVSSLLGGDDNLATRVWWDCKP